jgi:hypothetical protein
MLRKSLLKIGALLSVVLLLSVAMLTRPTFAIISQNTTSWFTNSDTNVASVAVGDVNGDGKAEIVAAGYYNDGTRWNAMLYVMDAF